MSQKKKRHQQDTASPLPEPDLTPPASERVRRILLGLVTAVVVARPLVLGEDPGMLSPRTDSSHLVLTLLWFLIALGWSVWRCWAGTSAWQGGVTEAALVVASVCVAASSAAASYKHPAILIAWEWFALVLGLFLIRQLAATASDRRHFIAVFLASAVSLSAYAVFQTTVEFPSMRQNPMLQGTYPLTISSRQAAALCGDGAISPLVTTSLLYRIAAEQADTHQGEPADEIVRQVQQGKAYATYRSASSFAGYLVLCLPALAAAAFLRMRQTPKSWETAVSVVCVFLGAAALLMTGSGQGGIIGLAIAGWAAFFVGRRRVGPARLLILLVTGFAFFAIIELRERTGPWSAPWKSAWAMIRAYPWSGAGAGNFGRIQPRFLADTGTEIVNDPGNFALELWATCGLFALAAVVVALGSFFWSVLRPVKPKAAADPSLPTAPEEKEPPRWEFYLWGMAGLLLGYVLRRIGQSPEELLQGPKSQDALFVEGFVTAFRAIIWFAAFGLFESVRWPGRSLSAALAIGVFGLLGQLFFSGGINFSSVAGPLWLAVGLALAGLDLKPHSSNSNSWLARAAPLPLALGFLIAFVRFTFDPVTSAMSHARASVSAYQQFEEDTSSNSPKIMEPRKYLASRVAAPLRDAVREDPGNIRWLLALSERSSTLWRIYADSSRRGPPAQRAEDAKRANEFAQEALYTVQQAQLLDPDGTQAFRAEYEVRMILASRQQTPKDKQRVLKNAAGVLVKQILRDQSNPWTHYYLAQTLREAGEPEEASEAARDALFWDERAAHPPRKLNGWQRMQLEQFAGPES